MEVNIAVSTTFRYEAGVSMAEICIEDIIIKYPH
jgi:hypothetical protein